MAPKRTWFERWLYRRHGLSLRCHRCNSWTFRDTCEPCRDIIDAFYNARLSIAFPRPEVIIEYIPMKWPGDKHYPS